MFQSLLLNALSSLKPQGQRFTVQVRKELQIGIQQALTCCVILGESISL